MSTDSGDAIQVVGVGARTPVGLRAASSAAAVRAGISRVVEHPYMLDKVGEPFRVALDQTLTETDRLGRLIALGVSAAAEAIEGLDLAPATRLGFYVALPQQGTFGDTPRLGRLTDALLERIAPRCHVSVETIPFGHAAGVRAIALAQHALGSGSADLALVLGTDSHIDPDFLERLDEDGRLMSSDNRWGYPPGEGAGALLFARSDFARRAGLPSLARLQGVGMSQESNTVLSERVSVGIGLSQAIRDACAELAGGETVSSVYCDLNGERYRSSEYLYTVLRLAGEMSEPTSYVSAVDAWGDVGAASIPLLTVLAVASAARGYAAGPHALVWASSESGLRGATLYQLRSHRRTS